MFAESVKCMKTKFLRLSLMLLVSAVFTANATAKSRSASFDWTNVMEAIIQVESEGDPQAVSGNSVGVLQITPVLVKDCNQILKKAKSNKRYTLADRYSVDKSKEMFLLIQSHYNPQNNVEHAIRLWNGGVKYSARATNSYFKKVMRHLKQK